MDTNHYNTSPLKTTAAGGRQDSFAHPPTCLELGKSYTRLPIDRATSSPRQHRRCQRQHQHGFKTSRTRRVERAPTAGATRTAAIKTVQQPASGKELSTKEVQKRGTGKSGNVFKGDPPRTAASLGGILYQPAYHACIAWAAGESTGKGSARNAKDARTPTQLTAKKQ